MSRSFQLTLIVFLAIFTVLGLITALARPATPQMTPICSSIMTPHLEAKISPGENLIYCASFQLAWNQLQDRIIRAPIQLSGNPRDAAILNCQQIKEDALPAGAYLAKAGQLTQDFLTALNRELKNKFGPNAPPEVKEPNARGAFLAYAYLYKAMTFPREFEALEEPIIFSAPDDNHIPVEGFGINRCHRNSDHQQLRQQVKVYDYRNENDFILTMAGRDQEDVLVLAKVKPCATLLKTIQTVEARIKKSAKNPTSLQEDETLQIPKIFLEMDVAYPQLQGLQILNKGWEGSRIAKARQWLRFKLDQKGASVKSEARIIIVRGALRPVRNYIFDRPFLLYLKKQGHSLPYLALWLETPAWFRVTGQQDNKNQP
ncbi:MAG TPA: hypothetical protein GX391_00825 [Firmicutes bacterium]|mgnify:CR=1 FL=1|jgi:hypothetical protein|nr:hypothetical protein [Bacillota bacterium]HOQ24843.1 hypothetical protein [Bacillota bacterium]HPT67948.1 hypothetical protein [Bacillota bacterium]